MKQAVLLIFAVILASATLLAAFGMSVSMGGMAGHDVACVSECISQVLGDAASVSPILVASVAILLVFTASPAEPTGLTFVPVIAWNALDRRRRRNVVRRE